MLRYAITDGAGASPAELASCARNWAEQGIDLIQLREPTLAAGELYAAARAMLAALGASPTRLLVNSRADVAVASGAHGVHLTSRPGELTPAQVRALYQAAGRPQPVVAVSCHTLPEVEHAAAGGASLLVLGPVFEKRVHGELIRAGSGLDLLRQACLAAGEVPVFALGGITEANTSACLAKGAKGIAAIRLFANR